MVSRHTVADAGMGRKRAGGAGAGWEGTRGGLEVCGTGAVKVYQIPVGAGAGKKFQPWNSSRCVLQCNSCLDT